MSRVTDSLHIRLDGDNIPGWNRLSYARRQTVLRIGWGVSLSLVLVAVLFPISWMWSTSLRPPKELFTTPTTLLPREITLSNFTEILTQLDFPTWYFNSIVVALGVVLLTTSTATLAGYGLTRLDIPYKKTYARLILFGYMFPPILLAIPMFIFWRKIGWINSLTGVMFAEMAVTLPFSIWLMWKFFQTVPTSLEESAMVGGASRFRAFYEIALPMAKPGMVAVGVFSYAVSWTQFTIPQVMLVESNKWVLTIGLFSLTIQSQVLWGKLMAASALALIPSFLFVFFLQDYLLRGFRAGDIG